MGQIVVGCPDGGDGAEEVLVQAKHVHDRRSQRLANAGPAPPGEHVDQQLPVLGCQPHHASASSHGKRGLERLRIERDPVRRQLGNSVRNDRACEVDRLAARASKQKLCDAHACQSSQKRICGEDLGAAGRPRGDGAGSRGSPPPSRQVPFSPGSCHRRSRMQALEEIDRGRESYATGAWTEAYESLSRADRAEALGGADLELLARSAYMLGRDDDYVGGLERAHHAHLDAGEGLQAVRCAFWIGHNLLFRGETVGATGWFARAHRLLERESGDSVERGYLLIPVWLQQMGSGDHEAGYATAAEAAAIG
jgi:hypothetical protein